LAIPLASAAAWNPLRMSGTALPAPLLLAAKLIVLVLIAQGVVGQFSDRFLPFIEAFDDIGIAPGTFRWLLQAAFAAAAVLLFLNRVPRAASLTLGLVLLVSILSSRLFYENNRVFAALLLVLIGLHEPLGRFTALRSQVVVLYFLAALNKLLNPHWRDGTFFETWNARAPYDDLYATVAEWFPDLALSMAMGWSIIATEFVLAALFLFRRLWPVAIWSGVAYHTSLTFLNNRTFGVFWYVACISYLAFTDRPGQRAAITLDPARGPHRALRRVLGWLDRDDTLEVRDAAGARPGADGVLAALLTLPVAYLIFVGVAALQWPQYRIPAAVVFAILGLIAWSALARRRTSRSVATAA
jgi:hypothetical protein